MKKLNPFLLRDVKLKFLKFNCLATLAEVDQSSKDVDNAR